MIGGVIDLHCPKRLDDATDDDLRLGPTSLNTATHIDQMLIKIARQVMIPGDQRLSVAH